MSLTVALAGDTMLGRGVAPYLTRADHRLLAGDLQEIARSADVFIVNLECCISDRGERVRDLGKRFFFRAPPAAAERLAEMGVSCVTLANNHARDPGRDALQDTPHHLSAAGIASVGAGSDTAVASSDAITAPALGGRASSATTSATPMIAPYTTRATCPRREGRAPPLSTCRSWSLSIARAGVCAAVGRAAPRWGAGYCSSTVLPL